MTKLHEREPKSGDKFLHRNQSISSFGALLPEIVEQRLVVIKGSDNDIEFYNYPSGKYYADDKDNDEDIIGYYDGPEKIEGWVNIYYYGISVFSTKKMADDFSGRERIACKRIEITYTPGEGLS